MNARSTVTEQAVAEQAVRPRMSDPTELIPELATIGGALYKATGNRSVPRTTIGLIHLRAGQIVGNTYLTLMHSGLLRKAGESEERIAAVASWKDAPFYTAAERVALELVEAVILPNPRGERVSDDLYARVAEQYDEKALATLTVAIGQVNFFTALAVVGKPLAGVGASGQWG
ncbi:carboxymuconolactone decarboxylase family protein [Streptomyces sp. NPDC006529]|uniref:carboxymuconolactone decarboxylase family protein n=1 Tax=Streptomyces sp. NPDC006529 TaxID=3157177 RepID=UPI0033B31EA8